MAKLTILEYPDPRLRTRRRRSSAWTTSSGRLIDDMFETMYAAPGIGLAATQVDVPPARCWSIDVSEDKIAAAGLHQSRRSSSATGELEVEEGCLSVPGIFDTLDGPLREGPRARARPRRQAVRARGRRAARRLHPARDRSPRRQAVRRLPLRAQAQPHPQEAREGQAQTARRRRSTRVADSRASDASRCASSSPARQSSRCRRSQALHDAGHAIVAVYTQPDRPAGRGREARREPGQAARARARPAGRAAGDAEDARRHSSGSRRYAPDLMVVVAYGLILPQAVLDMPRLGCLNIHASLLPRWRGAAPIQRADPRRRRRAPASRSCRWTPGSTPGRAAAARARDRPRETAGELHDRLAQLGAEAIVDGSAGLGGGPVPRRRSRPSGATYAAKIRKEEARIDWSQAADAIDRQVRAFNPWPVAETRLGEAAGAHLGGVPGAGEIADESARCAGYRRAGGRRAHRRRHRRRPARAADAAVSRPQAAQGRATFSMPGRWRGAASAR